MRCPHVVTVGPDDDKHRKLLDNAGAALAGGRSVELTIAHGKAEDAIAEVVGKAPDALLVMGAYGHSPLRTLIVASTTTTLIRTVHVPVLLVR